jgi:hypothetical protein
MLIVGFPSKPPLLSEYEWRDGRWGLEGTDDYYDFEDGSLAIQVDPDAKQHMPSNSLQGPACSMSSFHLSRKIQTRICSVSGDGSLPFSSEYQFVLAWKGIEEETCQYYYFDLSLHCLGHWSLLLLPTAINILVTYSDRNHMGRMPLTASWYLSRSHTCELHLHLPVPTAMMRVLCAWLAAVGIGGTTLRPGAGI